MTADSKWKRDRNFIILIRWGTVHNKGIRYYMGYQVYTQDTYKIYKKRIQQIYIILFRVVFFLV